MKRFWDKVEIGDTDKCWKWKASVNGKPGKEYGQFWYNGKMVLAHRMAYALFHNDMAIMEKTDAYHQNDNNFKCVLHHCDNTKCCNPHHLYLGNNTKNIKDKISRNRQQHMRGSANGLSKLTEADVIEMRKIYIPRKNGGIPKIADDYNVSITTAWQALKGLSWRHVQDEEGEAA